MTRHYSEQEVARFDEPIRDYALAARRLASSLLAFRCPACGQGNIFKNALYLKETCPYCQVRFEREPGGLIVSMVLNYFLTVLALLASAILLVRRYGFTDWLMPLLMVEMVFLVALFYRPTKALYLWFIWLLGFVHIDRPKQHL